MEKEQREEWAKAIARTMFEHLTDIDGDEADWLYFEEMLTSGAHAVLKMPIKREALEHGRFKDWKWLCQSCGVLTNDGECDCTKNADTAKLQVLIRNP